ncbi:S1C family serine protease [Polyangium sorediatum]|uniref:Trypsin-like peptidase domain-containing protein n=1 Tax=Polyangium sorediatum TaxID=889274 RepID=A0ABT6NRN4_9BACT|nr:trypsin-like peptidase domain-containing protein [Polyangium sorediatum]MDI1430936.1 trypsin-like peptidase domain-containing protein [Polyangium sorediatum]
MNSRRPLLSRIVLISWLLVAASACGKGGGASSGSSPPGEGTSSLPPGAIALPSSTASTGPPALAQTGLSAPAVVTAEGAPISFAPLAKKADPAVATVKARVEKETSSGRRRAVSEGLGTAFVYDPEGFMLTNNHVIEDATDIVVGFVDGREMRATVVGRDKHTDIAVLRVDERGLPSLSLGDSDGIDVGDWVVAIGNPFGLSHTVSAGILSAKGRTRDDVKGLDPSGYFNFLQTDASINPGNSGGPLLNMRSEVVGINAAVRANANNIGFAIPINMVKQLLPMLLRDGKIRRSALGVFVDGLNPIEAGRLRRPDRKGAWVQKVIAGGPADRAGLSPDDVIVAFDGKSVADPNELRWLASIAGVNKTVTLRIARLERVFDVRVTLSELEPIDDREEP